MDALVVDDSKVMRRLLRSLLQGVGYAVDEAESGEAAVTRLGERPPPALLLVDWNMPGMTGLDLVRILRADPRYAHSRIVMVTTETSVARMTEALMQGADEYLMKPFVREALIEKLRMLDLPIAVTTPAGNR